MDFSTDSAWFTFDRVANIKVQDAMALFDEKDPDSRTVSFHHSDQTPLPEKINPEYEAKLRRDFESFGNQYIIESAVPDFMNVNKPFFDSLLEPVYCNGITIDGLCAVGKTSIGRKLPFKMVKAIVGKRFPIRNTHPSSCMGYAIESIYEMMQNKEFHVYDRLAINTLMWSNIWSMLGAMKRENHDFNKCGLRLFEYTRYLDDDVMNLMCSSTKNIIIVDSNAERARQRLFNRGEGTDVERSQWPDYINIQNYAYRMLHARWPHLFCLLDLAQFGGDLNSAQSCIADIIGCIHRTLTVDSSKSPFKFEPIVKLALEDYPICGNVKRERFRPLLDVKFTELPKRFAIHEESAEDSSKRSAIYFYRPHPEKIRVSFGREVVGRNVNILKKYRVHDPKGLWARLAEYADGGVLVQPNVLQFKNRGLCNEFINCMMNL